MKHFFNVMNLKTGGSYQCYGRCSAKLLTVSSCEYLSSSRTSSILSEVIKSVFIVSSSFREGALAVVKPRPIASSVSRF